MASPSPIQSTLLKVGLLTALWALPLAMVLILSANHAGEPAAVPYATYRKVLWPIAGGLIVLIFVGAYRAARFVPPKASKVANKLWYQDSLLVAILVFWALAPPSYFFVEYYAFGQQLLGCAKELKVACLSEVKTYSDLASKVWAGATALFVALTALAKNAA